MSRYIWVAVILIAAVGLAVTLHRPAPKPARPPAQLIRDFPFFACVGVVRGEDGQFRAKLVRLMYDNPIGEFRIGDELPGGAPWRVIDIEEKITPSTGLHPSMREAYCVIGNGGQQFFKLPETRPVARR